MKNPHRLPDNRSFSCKSTPHPSACGCHLPSSRRGLQEHCVHSQISHWRRLNEPPLCKGFASMRSMLAGLAERGLICKYAKHACRPRREEFGFRLPCVRGGGPRSGGRVVKTIPHRLRRSSLYTREPFNQLCFFSIFSLRFSLRAAVLADG